jgi:ferredoxin
MPKKYHIHVKTAAPRFHPIGKYTTVEFRENCAGSCRQCVKKNCVYDIFKENVLHMSAMEEPEYLYTCMSCFRCIQECTKGIFSRTINPDYRTLGDNYWHAENLHRLWYQAHLGKIPVSGAGYRGPFVGPGFDAMWTDMSEIVRPTRDGIHGREYINTCFELSRRETPLEFNPDMSLASEVPPLLELPIPLLFRMSPELLTNEYVLLPMAKAAKTLGTMLFVRPQDLTPSLAPFADCLIPCLTPDNIEAHDELIRNSRVVELAIGPGIRTALAGVRSAYPDIVLLVGIGLDRQAAPHAATLADSGVDTLHFYADDHGNELNADQPRFLKEMIREVHLKLVDQGTRQKINLVFSGGIAMAEHMAKAIICGADAVTADHALLIALECRLCGRCRDDLSCPVKLDEPLDAGWGRDRIINLVAAWQSQLIELMGAMGIREARRLRGEVGRSMSFEDLEKEHFGPIFGERKVPGLG